MADELNPTIIPTINPILPPVVVAPAPVVEAAAVAAPAPVVAPVVETVVATPVIATPVPEVTPTSEPVKADTGATTLLAEAPIPQPTPTPEVTQVVNTEGGQSVEPAPPPTYEPFLVPDLTLDQGRISEFTNLLSDLEVSGKADHAIVQAFGQKAVDFHVNEVKKALESHTQMMVDAFENQKTGWKDEVRNDPELGGNRFQTTLDSARTFIRTHGGTPDQQAEFLSVMDSSGLGNHKAVIRLFANAMAAMSEPKPLASVKPVPQPKSKTQTMYGRS